MSILKIHDISILPIAISTLFYSNFISSRLADGARGLLFNEIRELDERCDAQHVSESHMDRFGTCSYIRLRFRVC